MARSRRNPLAGIKEERPRLMATRAAVARAQAIIRRNPTAREWQDAIRRLAELMLTLPPLTPDAVLDPRETDQTPLPLVRSSPPADGKPAGLLDIARRFGLRIETLGVMWFLVGDARYRDRAKAELLAVCDFPNWGADEQFLITAETVFGAALGYDWLYDALSDAERQLVALAILDKAILPGLAQLTAAPPPPQHWATAPTNWNLVCNGALMIAALAIADEGSDAPVGELFFRCRAAVRAGFNGYDPDGGWAEGPGYWHYATQYAIYLLDSLDTALGTTLGLDAAQGLPATGLFRLHVSGPSGKFFNFADSEERHSGGYWLFWLARRYGHPVDSWIEDHRGKVHPMDLLWFDDEARDPALMPTSRHFRGPEVATLRGGWDRSDTFIGVKGGVNDACRHTHYDLGSFVLDASGVRWAIDLGPDDYNLRDYFAPEMRAQYYRTATIGHNTLLLNGECQPHTADAAIVRRRFRPNLSLVVIDLSEAYPSAVRVLRGVALIDRRHVLIVDEIVPDRTLARVDWQMHTTTQIALGDPLTVLTQPAPPDGAPPLHLYLRVVETIPGPPPAASVLPATPSGPLGQDPNKGVAKLVLRFEERPLPLRLSVLLSPDAAACAEPRLPAAVRLPLLEWAQPTSRRRPRLLQQNRIPGESRDPLIRHRFVEGWVPAFAGNAEFLFFYGIC